MHPSSPYVERFGQRTKDLVTVGRRMQKSSLPQSMKRRNPNFSGNPMTAKKARDNLFEKRVSKSKPWLSSVHLS